MCVGRPRPAPGSNVQGEPKVYFRQFAQPVVLASRWPISDFHPLRGKRGLQVPKRPVVLVVEDEVLIRMAAVAMIRSAGFEALQAANADDATKILEARDDIRVVFTDINLPGSMDGLKLAAAVRGRWPPVEFIITSGRRTPTADDMPERSLFIGKPYSSFQVVRALNELTAS
jgi:CheY-like chemotaxis protein